MPKAVHDLAIKLQGQGKSEDSAWAIANSQLGKTTKNDKNVGEMMQDQSPSMTNLKPSPQNTAGWPTSMNPSFANTMGQMHEDSMGGQQMPGQQMPGMPCDICGGPEHPPMDHPYLPRMPNDPMAMTQQMPQMPMAPLPMQAPPPMPQMPQQPPMNPKPAQTQAPGHEEGGMGSGEYPHGSGGGQPPGGQQQAPSGGGQSGGGQGGGGDGGFGGSMGGGKAPPGPIMSFETVSIPGGLSAQSVGAKKMNESIFKQVLDGKVGCGCHKSKKG